MKTQKYISLCSGLFEGGTASVIGLMCLSRNGCFASLAKKGFSPRLFSGKTVGIRRALRIHEPSLCHSVAAHVYLQQQLPVAGFVWFSSWVGILSLNRQENKKQLT